MKRDIEKDLMEIECAIKENLKRDNTFTMSVLQRCYGLVAELKKYKDLEEKGLLKIFPCKEGEQVYEIYRFLDKGAWEIDVHKIELEDLEKIGKTVFLTQAEVEETLKRMGREE